MNNMNKRAIAPNFLSHPSSQNSPNDQDPDNDSQPREEIVFICTQSLQLAATQVLENTLSCTFIVANWFHPTISNESEAHNIYFILSSHSSRNLSSSSVNKSQTGHSHLYFGRAGATFSYFRLNCFLKELTWFVFQPDPNQTICDQT